MNTNPIVLTFLCWLGLLNFHLTATAQPVVTTLAATAVTPTNATINGKVNPNGALTATYFQFGLTTNYGNIGTPTVLSATNVALAVPAFLVSTITGAAGTNWTQSTAPSANWHSIASSGDGSRLAATVFGGGIYTSTNSGATWTPSGAPTANWTSIASSSDGSRLAALINSGSSIYITTDGGATWTPSSVPAALWTSIASSGDGMRLAAVAAGAGNIYTSTNGGTTWTPTSAPTSSWVGIASSSDGTRLAAVVIGQNIYTSTNSGATWTPTSAPTLLWKSVASSFDGQRLVAGENGGGIYISTNGGTTWTPSDAPNASWWSIACSGDGTRLAAVINGGGIYTSTGASSNLTPNTTYHYELVGVNSVGTSLGGDLQFTTALLQPVAFSVNGSIQSVGGAFQLSFSNLSGFGFTVLATTNLGLPLSNWTVLGQAIEAPPGHYQFTDLQATNKPTQFYRVRSP